MDEIEIRQRLGGEYGFAKIRVQFSVGAVPNAAETEAKGYPVFTECDMVSKHLSDDKDFVSSYVDPDVEPKQFPKEWEAFQAAKTRLRPIPLAALPKMGAAIFATFKALGINTADDLLAYENLPAALEEYRTYAQHIKGIHDFAATGRKPRLKVAA